MPDPTEALTLQLLEWIAERPRSYAETLEAWRSTCPRLSIWEDACAAGLVDSDPRGSRLTLSPKGRAQLASGVRGEDRGGAAASPACPSPSATPAPSPQRS